MTPSRGVTFYLAMTAMSEADNKEVYGHIISTLVDMAFLLGTGGRNVITSFKILKSHGVSPDNQL